VSGVDSTGSGYCPTGASVNVVMVFGFLNTRGSFGQLRNYQEFKPGNYLHGEESFLRS
jgi:hypothetical protein